MKLMERETSLYSKSFPQWSRNESAVLNLVKIIFPSYRTCLFHVVLNFVVGEYLLRGQDTFHSFPKYPNINRQIHPHLHGLWISPVWTSYFLLLPQTVQCQKSSEQLFDLKLISEFLANKYRAICLKLRKAQIHVCGFQTIYKVSVNKLLCEKNLMKC